MKRVTGIGGIFFKAKDPVVLRTWHQKASLLKTLRDEGCNVLDKTDDSDYGSSAG